MYYLQSRYYDPQVGRFINSDGLIDTRGIVTQNVYLYCINNPVNNADPNGKMVGKALQKINAYCIIKPTLAGAEVVISDYYIKVYAATVYAEAAGQNRRSKQAVAHVMNNRIGTESSWTDIEAVISANCQFDGYNSPMYQAAMNYYNNGICDNSIQQAAMDECLAVVIPIYSGAETDITGGGDGNEKIFMPICLRSFLLYVCVLTIQKCLE